MSKKSFLIIFSMCFLFFSCKEDEITEELLFDPDVSASKVDVGGTLTFTDYSTGVKSRFWTFPGGNPETSTDEVVSVVFEKEGPITCKVEVTFLDDFTETKEFVIQVGNELYRRDIFGFEDQTKALEAWKYWISDGSDAMVFSLENTLGEGANGTNGFAKITINKPNIEAQLYTKGNSMNQRYNGVLESNKTYEFSFWVKSNDFTQLTAAEISNENEVQSWRNFAWYSPIRQVGTEWSFKTITFQTGDLTQIYAEGFANNAWTQFKFLQPTTGTLYIDEISLRQLD
ncbi:hypothetical protein [Polaribacter sp.]|uniref:hypothetical protein n=1 Tax=Polaribacter sp. TaxID=1920175 RepID=UPI0040489A31